MQVITLKDYLQCLLTHHIEQAAQTFWGWIGVDFNREEFIAFYAKLRKKEPRKNDYVLLPETLQYCKDGKILEAESVSLIFLSEITKNLKRCNNDTHKLLQEISNAECLSVDCELGTGECLKILANATGKVVISKNPVFEANDEEVLGAQIVVGVDSPFVMALKITPILFQMMYRMRYPEGTHEHFDWAKKSTQAIPYDAYADEKGREYSKKELMEFDVAMDNFRNKYNQYYDLVETLAQLGMFDKN